MIISILKKIVWSLCLLYTVNIVIRPNNENLLKQTYVVFDFETTGFNAGGADSIIEIGAVKICNGNVLEKYDELINPGRKLSQKIIDLTNITDDMLKDKDDEETAIKKFIAWVGDLPMVAHNAKFDVSFLEMAYKKYNLGQFTNPVIDTLELSRTLDNNYARHSLSALVKRYEVPWDEDAHHRGDYDALGTALVFHKMLVKLDNRRIENMNQLDELVSKEEIHKYGRSYHVNILVKNKTGLKNLFRLISLSNTTYLYKTPRILRSEIEKYREGLLIGSGCYESEIFIEARSKSDDELSNLIRFYDYVEVQPLECYNHLIQTGDFANEAELAANIKKIIRVTEEAGKFIVATGDVHHLTRDDKIYREIIINQKVPGGGRHPLARNNIKEIPSNHFRTTNEMIDNFSFLEDKDLIKRIVIDNPNKIAEQIEIIEVIIDTGGIPFSPRVKSDDGKTYLDCPSVVTDLVYTKAKNWYGETLPHDIEQRIATELYGDIVLKVIQKNLEKENLADNDFQEESYKRLHQVITSGFESVKNLIRDDIKESSEDTLTEEDVEKELNKLLGGIIGGGFDPIYLIAQKLVKHSNDEGYLVGSRGSVGSSFVATMMGITEVNPLPAHYLCRNCHIKMIKDGQDMPFATFLGFNADKVPDIDLNFSDLNQASAHAYTKVLFGENNVYRAGTIGTVADKTAYGFVKGYCEDHGITDMRGAEIERLAMGCTGVKRTTGQHPGGIVVIPDYMDVYDFTPFQFPADDITKEWRTTHFDYHAIDQCVLKLDILGHDDPTMIRMLQDLTGIDPQSIPLDDKETMSIFSSTKALGVSSEQIHSEIGSFGIPEFGTKFVRGMLVDTRPTTFEELVRISGLSHGTDVWLNNAQTLIQEGTTTLSEAICTRDDIMTYLIKQGVPSNEAFKIMESVRKGKVAKGDEPKWAEYEELLREHNVPEWYINSCKKIKYMFPKAHAVAYVTMAFRIAWFKVHKPMAYYAAYFSIRADEFDSEYMISGKEKVKNKMKEIELQGNQATAKDKGMYSVLEIVLEFYERGFKFLPIDLYKSHSTKFLVEEDGIRPPLNSIPGLGTVAAQGIEEARKEGKFMSIDDMKIRSKVGNSVSDLLKKFGCLDGMSQSNQLSLFG